MATCVLSRSSGIFSALWTGGTHFRFINLVELWLFFELYCVKRRQQCFISSLWMGFDHLGCTFSLRFPYSCWIVWHTRPRQITLNNSAQSLLKNTLFIYACPRPRSAPPPRPYLPSQFRAVLPLITGWRRRTAVWRRFSDRGRGENIVRKSITSSDIRLEWSR